MPLLTLLIQKRLDGGRRLVVRVLVVNLTVYKLQQLLRLSRKTVHFLENCLVVKRVVDTGEKASTWKKTTSSSETANAAKKRTSYCHDRISDKTANFGLIVYVRAKLIE